MSRMIKFILLMGLILSLALSACGSPSPTVAPATEASVAAEAPAAEVALKVTGSVASEQAWTEEEVKAMNAISVEDTNKNGEKAT